MAWTQVSSAGKKAGARLADLAERGKEQVAGALDAAAENFEVLELTSRLCLEHAAYSPAGL